MVAMIIRNNLIDISKWIEAEQFPLFSWRQNQFGWAYAITALWGFISF